jgi:hypothetical protein
MKNGVNRWDELGEVVTDQRCSEVDEVGFLLPMGLHQDAIDVIDVDGLGTTADCFDHAANAEVACLTQDAIGGSVNLHFITSQW